MPRRVPVDVIAFIAIAFLIVLTHLPFIRHGMAFNDPCWYFHFGRRTLDGAVPYRDYVFQVGPLPIYVDALFQGVFGDRYMSSLYAAMFLKIVRVFVVWLIARRLVAWPAAAGLSLYCAFDPWFASAHHWSVGYSQLLLTLAGLFLYLAVRADGRRALAFLALAGASAGLVMSARQSTAVVVGVVVLPATAILFLRKEYFTRARLVALWGGFAASLVLLFLPLAIAGALGPAIQQMFLDAPEKKSVHGIAAVLDAISGGALIDASYSWWGGALYFLAAPAVMVAAIVAACRRAEPITWAAVGHLLVPSAIVVGLAYRYVSIDFTLDTPRLLLTVTTAIAVFSPDRSRRWFGLDPVISIGFGGLALASDWALEMSLPGRGWGDGPSLVLGTVLIVLASTRVTARVKSLLCGGLGMASLLYYILAIAHDAHPVNASDGSDGPLTRTTLRVGHPLLRGMRIDEPRARIVAWLTREVPRGSTCFVYGNMPAVYDLLDCANPTALDTTAADFIAAEDARRAAAALRDRPPDFLVAQDGQWMTTPIEVDLGGDITRYVSLNRPATMAMHLGVRAILPRYELVGTSADVLPPELLQRASTSFDAVHSLRLYRRKR